MARDTVDGVEGGGSSPAKISALQGEREILIKGIQLGEELNSLRDTNDVLRDRVALLRNQNAALRDLAIKRVEASPPPATAESAKAADTADEALLLEEQQRLQRENELLATQQAHLGQEITRLQRDLSPAHVRDALKAPPTPPLSQLSAASAGLGCEYGGLRREHGELLRENERLRGELASFDWNVDEIPEGSDELRREVLAAMLRASFFPGASPRLPMAHVATPPEHSLLPLDDPLVEGALPPCLASPEASRIMQEIEGLSQPYTAAPADSVAPPAASAAPASDTPLAQQAPEITGEPPAAPLAAESAGAPRPAAGAPPGPGLPPAAPAVAPTGAPASTSAHAAPVPVTNAVGAAAAAPTLAATTPAAQTQAATAPKAQTQPVAKAPVYRPPPPPPPPPKKVLLTVEQRSEAAREEFQKLFQTWSRDDPEQEVKYGRWAK